MDYEEIKKLIDDMGNDKIDELEIEFPEGMKISMKKNTEKEIVVTNDAQMQANAISTTPTTNVVLNNQNNAEVPINETTGNKNAQEENYKIIKSPMVGTFYSRPAPNKGRNVEVKYAMSNSLGFGGHNSSIIFKKI